MTRDFALLDARFGTMLRVAWFRLATRLGATFSKRGATVRPHLGPQPVDTLRPQRRYRFNISLLGRDTGERLLQQAARMLSADGIVNHGARFVEASCTCEQRAKLVEFVEHASRTPGVTRVRWESIPGGR